MKKKLLFFILIFSLALISGARACDVYINASAEIPYVINQSNTRYCLNDSGYVEGIPEPYVAILFDSTDNSVLDCQYFNLSSNYSNEGIKIEYGSGNSIMNCTITHFHTGFQINESDSSNILNNTIIDNSYGADIRSSSDGTFIGNVFKDNVNYGVVFSVWYSERPNCTDNYIFNNTFDNDVYGLIFGTWSSNNSIINNTANSNSGFGIELNNYAYENVIANNTGSGNYVGISLWNVQNNNVTNNTFNSNTYSGIYSAGGSSYNLIEENTFNNNLNGITWGDGSSRIIGNDVNGNSNYGIYLYENNNHFIDNLIDNNPTGIYINDGSSNEIRGNVITGNSVYGIYGYRAYYSIFINNTINSNDEGIYLEATPTGTEWNNITNNIINAVNLGIHLRNDVPYVDMFGNSIDTAYYGIYAPSSNNKIIGNSIGVNAGGYSCIYIDTSYGNNVTNNTLKSNANGVEMSSGYSNRIENNIIESNVIGVYLTNSYNNTIIGNREAGNSYQIQLSSSYNNTVTKNVIYGSGGSGVEFISSYNNTVSNNTIDTNAYGIHLSSSSYNNNLFDNILMGSSNYAVFLDASNSNVLTNNNANYNSGGFGFFIYGGSSNNIFVDNIANGNYAGIVNHQSSANNTYINNILENNTGIGFYAVDNCTISGGSIALNQQYDYYLQGDYSNFTDTNFTATRVLHFYNGFDGSEEKGWFNYRNASNGLWLRTYVLEKESTLTRTLYDMTPSLLQWEENSSANNTAYYEIAGLNDSKSYRVYNNSVLVNTLTPVNEVISFTIYLGGGNNITVEEYEAPPAPAPSAFGNWLLLIIFFAAAGLVVTLTALSLSTEVTKPEDLINTIVVMAIIILVMVWLFRYLASL